LLLFKEACLVAIRKECNLKKSDMTLNQYIKKFKMDRESIESTLDKLGKDY